MKTFYKVVLCLFILVLQFNISKSILNENYNCSDMMIIENEKTYEIVKSKERYILRFYSSANKCFHEEIYDIEPTIQIIDNNLIQVCISVGSPAHYLHYVNVKDCKISEAFFNPILINNNIIAYMESSQDGLILQDIFLKKKFYKKIKRNFLNTANPMSAIIKIKLNNDNISLTYFTGKTSDFYEITENIKIN